MHRGRGGWAADLIIDGAGADQKLPVCWAGDHVEGARVDQHVAAEVAVQRREVGEAYVVADAEPDPRRGAICKPTSTRETDAGLCVGCRTMKML